MNDCTFIILGATGDLTKRKLIPALYQLIKDSKIEKYAFVGAALEDNALQDIFDRARSFIREPVDEQIWNDLIKRSVYQQLDFKQPDGFKTLEKTIKSIEKKWQLSGNRLVYLAVSATFFCSVTKNLGISGIVKRAHDNGMVNGIWQRIVYEKPFGSDLASAREINECIVEYFNEHQIYRIDHYLTKALVANILLVRFTNIIFEPLWNKKYIDQVQIIMTETLGLEGRGRYYDAYGVLKDVVQNHVMQLLSLIGMELPTHLDAKAIQDQKAAVLKKIQPINGFLGQYTTYHEERDVKPDSSTPTFACLKMAIGTDRWQGVPFYVLVGKKLSRKESAIHIKFKEVDCVLQKTCQYASNILTIQIDPDPSFSLCLNTQRPGSAYEVSPVRLSFSQDNVFKTETPKAYELLLEQIMQGDQSVSVRFDEIEYAWSIIEKIEAEQLPQYYYEVGTDGPKAIKKFQQECAMRWYS